MSDYRRSDVSGGTYFFTVVTHQRRPLFRGQIARDCLRAAIKKVKLDRPFELIAIVLLPDHWHCICALPQGDSDYSVRLKRIKEEFTVSFLEAGGAEGKQSPSRLSQGERAIWQRRFWEHTLKDEEDLKRCVDYIHWNPVKHQLVRKVVDWPWSSFHRFVRAGEYEANWGSSDPTPGYNSPEWGE